MTMRRDAGRVRLLAVLATLLAVAGGALRTPSTAHAAPATGNYQLDVQVKNTGPFSIGGSTLPQFQATLTALNGATLSSCSGSTYVTLTIDSDPGQTWGATSQSAPDPTTCIYGYANEPGWSGYTDGTRSATAQATVSGQGVATATVTFTVNKAVTTTSCFVNTPGTNYQAGSTLQIGQQVQGPTSAYEPDWTKSTYGVTFTGPTSVTHTNITPDGSGWLNVQAPATPGQYAMTCSFDGYGEFARSTSTGSVGVAVSAFHPVGGIALYTNPTTYNPSQSCDLYIVIRPAPGGPAPSGYISITIGQNTTSIINLAADGTQSVHLGPLPAAAGNQINVAYNGDSYYRWANTNFSFTNPAIPGGSGGGGGSPQATASATTSAAATGTASGATPAPPGTTHVGAGSTGSSSGSSGGNPLLWIILGLVVLGLGGGGLALVLRARRAAPQRGDPLSSPRGVPQHAPHKTGWPSSD